MEKKCTQKAGKSVKLKTLDPPKWDFGHRTRNFRRVTDIHNMREGLRAKITASYFEEYNTVLDLNLRENEKEVKQIKTFHEKIEPQFTHWRDQFLQAAMSSLEKLEHQYEETSTLEQKHEEILNDKIVVNMRIIYLENDLVKFTIYQNFQYLMSEYEWRVQNDWIHKDSKGLLEPVKASIEKRKHLFIRKRDDDDAFLVKKFFFEKFEPIKHERLLPFQSTNEFIEIIENVQDKTVQAIFNLHVTMWEETNLKNKFKLFQKGSLKKLKTHQMHLKLQGDQKKFTEKRTKVLAKETNSKFSKDLTKSCKNRARTKVDAMLDTILYLLLPENERDVAIQSFTPEEKAAHIEDKVHDLLTVIDSIPAKILAPIEAKVRKQRKWTLKTAAKAFDVELQMKNMIKSINRSLEPPFVKPPLQRPLPISRLPPRRKKAKKPPSRLTSVEKIFLSAFADDEAPPDLKSEENQKYLRDIENSTMPFYYDHFLKLHGYVPDKNFVTMVEQRDGKEEDRFRHKDVLPQVMQRIKIWEKTQEMIKKYHIAHTAFLYEDRESFASSQNQK